ncbi:hypothetical protein K493DRAFT_310166 [Basidiobolus meristosporus CBS 931.73]|uniref:Transmembrane protein n=1 Tax=Basidiobolus meristosporus CBS 931.73 TaxID=1314790 RepID=A0A1Y1ZBK3_9FUNG|nr:hypothetical protein K493DRAFT_310166 [Basidiobolus meristosporus CBS 931.73]|eukprot:ORY07629.1 hypothetical protein K493DRAFT_310166 [Basidiobolus meristosporus CBS 931.73]
MLHPDKLIYFVVVIISALVPTGLAQSTQCDISVVETGPVCPQVGQKCFVQTEGFLCLPGNSQGCVVTSSKVIFQPVVSAVNATCFHCQAPANPSLRNQFLKWAFGPNEQTLSPYYGNCASNTLFCGTDNLCKEKIQVGGSCSDTIQCSDSSTCKDGTCQKSSKWDKVKNVVYIMLSIIFLMIVFVVAFFVFCSRNTLIFCPI